MFRNMRRNKQLLSKEDTEAILLAQTAGVLSVHGDDGYPYGVPVSYLYDEGKIYFHCAKEGHKIDAIRGNQKVSFTVIDKDQIVGEELTTYFRSVIIFGKARILSTGEEFDAAIYKLSRKYAPELSEEKILHTMKNSGPNMYLIAIDIEHITGKEAIELVRMRSAH